MSWQAAQERRARDPEYDAMWRAKAKVREQRRKLRKAGVLPPPPTAEERAMVAALRRAAYAKTYREQHAEEMRAKGRERMRLRYRADPAFRAKKREKTLAWRRQKWAEDAEFRAKHIAYLRAWRAANPRPAVDTTPLPLPYTGHPLLEQAREIAGHTFYGTDLYDPLREDGAGIAVVALLEGKDQAEAGRAVRNFYVAERGHRYRTRLFSETPAYLIEQITEPFPLDAPAQEWAA